MNKDTSFKTPTRTRQRYAGLLISMIGALILLNFTIGLNVMAFQENYPNSQVQKLTAQEDDPTRTGSTLSEYTWEIYVDQAAYKPQWNIDFGLQKGLLIFTNLEKALSFASLVDSIYLCPGHLSTAGLIDENVSLVPSQNSGVCNSGQTTIEKMPDLLGDLGCQYGNYDCNRCVWDVVDAFQNLGSGSSTYAFDLNGHPDPPFHMISVLTELSEDPFHGHWQGIQRLNYFSLPRLVVARDKIYDANNHERAGYVIVDDDRIIKTWYTSDTSPPESEHPYLSHPGGIQLLGDIMVLPLEPEAPEINPPVVSLIDLSDPLNAVRIDNPSEPIATRANVNKGSMAAAAKLNDGRYLIIVGRSGTPLDFYISDEPNNFDQFSFLYRWPGDWKNPDEELWFDGNFKETNWDSYQNINLLTDCRTGRLYLAATGNRLDSYTPRLNGNEMPTGKDWADLYRLDVVGNEILLFKVSEIHLPIDRATWKIDLIDQLTDPFGLNPLSEVIDQAAEFVTHILQEDSGNFDAAAGLHVDRYGCLYLYTTQHGWITGLDGKHYTNLMEFGPTGCNKIQMSRPGVHIIPGDKLVQLVIDLITSPLDTAKFVVWDGPIKIGSFAVSQGGALLSKINPFGSQTNTRLANSDAIQPPLEVHTYTVTFEDDYGNESLPSLVVTATYGLVELSMPDIEGPTGSEIFVPLTTPNASAMEICQANFDLSYDPLVLTPTAILTSSLTSAYEWSAQVITPGLVNLSISETIGTALYGGGALFNMGFDVIGTSSQTSTLAIDSESAFIEDCTQPGSPLHLNFPNDATFAVSTTNVLGDLNSDGQVTEEDAFILQQIATGSLSPSNIHWQTGDLNYDGQLNTADAVLVMRLAAGLNLFAAEPSQPEIRAVDATTVTLSVSGGGALSQNATTSVSIHMNSVDTIGGGDFVFAFDHHLIAIEGVSAGPLAANFDLVYHEPISGQLHLSLKPKIGYEGGLAGGNGTLLNMVIRSGMGIQGEDPSVLNLLYAGLSDPYGKDFQNTDLQIGIEISDSWVSVEDTQPPELEATYPVDEAYFVQPDQAVYLGFSESIDTASLALSITPAVNFTPTWNSDHSAVVLSHPGFLEETQYQLEVNAADIVGHPMTQTATIVFTTTILDETPPQVLAVTPNHGASDISLEPSLVITFSEAIYANGLTISITPTVTNEVGEESVWDLEWNFYDTVVTATQQLTLASGTSYTITIYAEDRFYNSLVEPFEWVFTTVFTDYDIYLPLILKE